MKQKNIMMMAGVLLILASCNDNDVDYDAAGVFETTEVIVSARGTGEIISLNISEGQTVNANEQLGCLDMTQLELKKSQLNAGKEQLNATNLQLNATNRQFGANKEATDSRILDLEKQVATLRQQIRNAQSEYARFKALLADGAATEKQVDDIGYQISVLQKQLTSTQEQINAANKSLAAQSKGVVAQQQGVTAQQQGVTAQQHGLDAQIGQIDDQMRQAIIFSPIDGVILSKYAEQGEFAAPGRALFKVADVSQMKLRAYVSADILTKVKIGQKVKVYADLGEKGRKEYEGVVSWISNEAEFTPKTIQTRDERSNLVYAVKIDVRNDGLIKRGMYGDVKF